MPCIGNGLKKYKDIFGLSLIILLLLRVNKESDKNFVGA